MAEWKAYKLGEVINLKRGYDLPNQNRQAGNVPILSSSGIMDFHAEAKVKGPGVVTGRYGTIGQVFYTADDYWPLNTTLYVQDFKGNAPKFIYYLLKGFDFEKYSDKSAVPGVNRNDLHSETVTIPPLPEQQAIAEVFSSLDDKIDLLHRQNKTLEALAETLFRKWFVEEADEGWETRPLEQLCTITRGASPRPIIEYVKNGTVPWIKIADATGSNTFFIDSTKEFIIESGVGKSVKVSHGDLILSNSATCGLPYFVEIEGCIHDGWLLFRDFRRVSKFYTFFFLKQINRELNNFADGSVQNNLNTGILKEYPVNVPPEYLVKKFDEEAGMFVEKIKRNVYQIRTLTTLRDTLLPKLMSGVVRVNK